MGAAQQAIISFAEQWSSFSAQALSAAERLASELARCRDQQFRILEGQEAESRAASPPVIGAPHLATYRAIRRETAHRLLGRPVAEWDRNRQHGDATTAFQTFDRSLKEALRLVPESALLSGAEAAKVLEPWLSRGWLARVAGIRKNARPIPLRSLLAARVRRLSRKGPSVERRYWPSLMADARRMKIAWEAARELVDGAVIEPQLAEGSLNNWRKQAAEELERVKHEYDRSLAVWKGWPKRAVGLLAEELLADILWRPRRAVAQDDDRDGAVQALWLRRWRAIDAELHLEAALERVEDRIISRFGEALESAAAEQAVIHRELDAVIDWLSRAEGSFPPPGSDLVAGANRTADLERQVRQELELLPEASEVMEPLTGWRGGRPRRLDPRQVLHQAFTRAARPEVEAVFGMVEAEHRELVQAIERARQVVAFGSEVAAAERDIRLRAEAIENAVSLMRYYGSRATAWEAAAAPRLAKALAEMYTEAHRVLGSYRVGAWTLMAQRGVRRAAPVLARQATEAFHEGVTTTWRAAERAGSSCLEFIGWKRVSPAGRMEVIRRSALPAEFTARGQPARMPALYRHLFRVDPVEDARFLVGRDGEMAAIAEARSLWEVGRPASLLIVGTRGSGKTSLVNCAMKQALGGGEAIRGEFHERVATEQRLREHLARLTGSGDPARLEEFLTERRRILVIEELERTFLRRVGGFEAVRALQRLIAATCGSTLWLLAVNATAFRFMNAAMGFGASFSHRIDAATASREDLRRAILQRHALSGLRLQFAATDPPRARRLGIGSDVSPEEAFFETLSVESDGVFRTAFDIWLSHIDAIEDGLMYMKPLRKPDLAGIIEDLDQADLFTLCAVMQHGSLTIDEHSVVFQMPAARSRAQIDELLAREILEPDPGRTGFRVRPKAQRVVTEALYRRNLL